eukprot:TRINITY_DN2952_c0_g1_i1.p1 TRINITY_DN2952_c0_g1~~TRINITY_DN2952_c0_g1_i1.p1  ORF type:complete len:206 (+),score=48.34 TRINITY_DN2952_c0_g1_i1:628-1245(+)
MNHEGLVRQLEEKLHHEVLGVYIQGSRLWGCNGTSSDYDLLVILKEGEKGSTHIGVVYDVTYMGEAVFLERVRANCVYELCAVCVPKGEFIIKEYKRMPKIGEVLNLANLKTHVTTETPKILTLSSKFGAKSDFKRQAKLLTHAYHLAELAHQLATTKTITDFTMNLKNFRDLLALNPESWEAPDWDTAESSYNKTYAALTAVLP